MGFCKIVSACSSIQIGSGNHSGPKLLVIQVDLFIYWLQPGLWTLVLSHRTQILYISDISFVVMCLEIVLGCLVLESGTGSGSLTTSLARAVALNGHVYTFDFHEQRVASAREDFEKPGWLLGNSGGERYTGWGIPGRIWRAGRFSFPWPASTLVGYSFCFEDAAARWSLVLVLAVYRARKNRVERLNQILLL